MPALVAPLLDVRVIGERLQLVAGLRYLLGSLGCWDRVRDLDHPPLVLPRLRMDHPYGGLGACVRRFLPSSVATAGSAARALGYRSTAPVSGPRRGASYLPASRLRPLDLVLVLLPDRRLIHEERFVWIPPHAAIALFVSGYAKSACRRDASLCSQHLSAARSAGSPASPAHALGSRAWGHRLVSGGPLGTMSYSRRWDPSSSPPGDVVATTWSAALTSTAVTVRCLTQV